MSTVVILNGVPRSGKSSIARAIQENFDDVWLNLGVDVFQTATPASRQPGIGLRPGGERPDLEDYVATAYRAMFASIAAHAQRGLNVVTDVGLHDDYSAPLAIRRAAAEILNGLPVLFVGVRCPVDVVRQRRRDTWGGTGVAGVTDAGGQAGVSGTGNLPGSTAGTRTDDPVMRWERAVHSPRRYDLEVDTSRLTPQECAERIAAHLRTATSLSSAAPLGSARPTPSATPTPSAAAPPSAFFDLS
ncbi:chloramphenicol phosphotransferase CPT family protein [Occultella aeris]|uniref:Chloramphenicol 3-O phosphotransferase n=1 Tax=Occultella aeris TaxID=2761496 RepID=A0A7M4DSL7_9MICO|nr:chloramphenicol phosphotransferase [Occultella aeris]VZO40461.1 Chloramphenicol 3-O phosphotransferase [Occultella aeris]